MIFDGVGNHMLDSRSMLCLICSLVDPMYFVIFILVDPMHSLKGNYTKLHARTDSPECRQ